MLVRGARALRRLADKVCRIIRAADAFVLRHLRIRADRPRHVDAAGGDVRRANLVGPSPFDRPALKLAKS